MHGAHAHRMRRLEVARLVLEHGRAARVDPVTRKHRIEGLLLRFGQKPCMFNAIDRIKGPGEATLRDHPFGIGRAAIGVDDLAPRQGADALI